MKKTAVLAIGLVLMMCACGKKADANAPHAIVEEQVQPDPVPEAANIEPIDTTGYTTTGSGLKYKVIKQGQGLKPGENDVVTVHYTGKHMDGRVFDSSVERGEPTRFPLNGVIKGWIEGVQMMSPGAVYQFIIPSKLAYGPSGTPGGPIKPDETLYFEVELIKVGE